jgi:hypothetical protein
MMGDWYDENIEEGVRDVVRALRDNGFNTESSCHHDMSVQMQYIPDGGVKRLHDLMWCRLHEAGLPVTFEIQVSHSVVDGRQFTFMTLRLPKGEAAPQGLGSRV